MLTWSLLGMICAYTVAISFSAAIGLYFIIGSLNTYKGCNPNYNGLAVIKGNKNSDMDDDE